MLKRPDFEHLRFYNVANDLSQFDNSLSLKEDDVMLRKLPFGSANAVNEVSKQSSASKKDNQFNMGKSWFQNGRIRHGNSLQGESYFKSSGKFDQCIKSFFFSADYSCCSANFNNLHHDSINLSNGRSVDSRDSLSFSQKLHLMKSGRF